MRVEGRASDSTLHQSPMQAQTASSHPWETKALRVSKGNTLGPARLSCSGHPHQNPVQFLA